MIATITIESKKRYKRMVIAVCLAISMFVGSAFALSPSYQNVSMPDPYGIMPLSLSDESSTRTIYNSSSIRYGAYSSILTYSSQTAVLSPYSSTANYYVLASTSGWYAGGYLYVPSGSYIDFSASYSLDAGVYSSLVISGGIQAYLKSNMSVSAYPDTVQPLVNGVLVGSPVSLSSSGSGTIPDIIVELSSNVTSVGLRFTWNTADTVTNSSSSGGLSRILYFYVTDNVNLTPILDESLDYEPFFERVIAWEQSIHGAIQSLGDSLSSSLGGVGESASRIANVFARDDDIQLRDDVDEAVTEVTDSFFTPVADGETETEFDSATKIDKQKVTDVKQVAEGASALFDTGYEFTDGFEIIATDDSFLSWFTAETATALDTTAAVATVGDDDPYNMHFYYDHLQEIEVWKGD